MKPFPMGNTKCISALSFRKVKDSRCMENKALLDEKFWGKNSEAEEHPVTEAEMAAEIGSDLVFESVGCPCCFAKAFAGIIRRILDQSICSW